jgi:hypothetical protein
LLDGPESLARRVGLYEDVLSKIDPRRLQSWGIGQGFLGGSRRPAGGTWQDPDASMLFPRGLHQCWGQQGQFSSASAVDQ